MGTQPGTILVTGGAGFIGSNFLLGTVGGGRARVVTLDKLTYAANKDNLAPLDGDERHTFVQGDVGDRGLVLSLLRAHRPQAIVHFAAESHVDRSIDGPGAFVHTNVVGTFELLEATRAWLAEAGEGTRESFRFVHVSTDEVVGSLGPTGLFREDTPYAASSPYSASKAASDLFVRAYHRTYGVPTITVNSTNAYGPHQFPEKLVPLMVLGCLEGRPLPVYGDGGNVRDWIFVQDLCDGLHAALLHGPPGESYLFGARNEQTNLDMVHAICDVFDDLHGAEPGTSRRLVTFVADRPGHDRRYAVDPGRAERELGWRAAVPFREGLRRTVSFYLDNPAWCAAVQARYARERLGLGK